MSDHRPVLLAEAVEGLAVNRDGCYVDATYGRGGHSAEILARLGDDGRLLAIDQDPDAVADAMRRFADDARFTIRHADFRDLPTLVPSWLGASRLSGILFDLGVSSPQLDEAGRGFSFSKDGPLDMRMNPDKGHPLSEWLATVDELELAEVIGRYGEQRGAYRIAAAICRARAEKPLTRTQELAAIVRAAAPRANTRIDAATRVFQALRIAVNDELRALDVALTEALELLAAGGRLVVISFHSLEDRIVKRFFARESRGDPVYVGLPEIPPEARPRLRVVGGLVRPTDAEIARNPRARSSRMRVAEKLPVAAPRVA
jgi:16S rRNA (cytosine1402-N4)-methyltransferase